MSSTGRRVPAIAVALAGIVLITSVLILGGGVGTPWFQRAYGDLIELFVAAAAAATAGWAAVHSTGRTRLMWLFAGIASGSWAAGEAVWSWYELARGIDTPFPSLADVGFLMFPVAACVALLVLPSRGSDLDRGRRVLDATLATTGLALVSWETALGAVAAAGGDNRLAFAVSLAYPLSDFLLLALLVLILNRAVASRAQLVLLAAGMAALSVSDSGFAYLTTEGSYDGGAIDLGWVFGFVLLALAPLVSARRAVVDEDAPALRRSSFLPYIPVVIAGALTVIKALTGHRATTGQTGLVGVIVALVLVRQYLTLRENTGLADELATREAQLRHQAFHDALTGLANRALFQDRLGHALDLHARDLRPVSVLFLDIDDFKLINDSMGHAAGDELLLRIAERLGTSLRTGDTVARLGGDEFAILLEDDGDPVVVAGSVEAALQAPFVVKGRPISVGTSIGVVALQPADAATTADALLAKADTAMYAAKRGGKGQLRVFREGMSLTELADNRMSQALAAAVTAGELRLEYQPIVNLDTGAIAAVEALARWSYEGREVPPSEFIPVAERTGVIADLTDWALDEACRQLAVWSRTPGREQLQIAVNVAPAQVTDDAFVRRVADVLAKHDVAPGRLVLEITESSLLADVEVARRVTAALRATGVRISLDDFGVGFSSLSQLHAIELDIVKIDRSFIDRLDTDPRQVRFLGSLLRLGADLGLDVVAEGVERRRQLELVRELGCRLVQGYLLARPMPADRLPAALVAPG
ncbi:MAG: diguanylate cyclase [Actinomycetota bacterium]|nr:diguanylate cyclase [Actinomycetota bacterium]